MFKRLIFGLIVFLMVFNLPEAVFAGEAPTAASNAVAIDTIWVLLASVLVFFMQAGFAMVAAGFTRAKSVGNILMKNLVDFSAGSLTYWLVGFAIMFGISHAGFLGITGFAMTDNFGHLGLDIPIWAFLIFQTVFAATAATIVAGAMAERTKFYAYLIYTVVITSIIYPVAGHWIWGGGWLGDLGMVDFAGSTVVHSVGGWAALVGAYIIGPRIGKYDENGKSNAIPGHNIALGALGVFILWFGWFGFNPGSTLAGTDLSIAMIAVTTNLSAASGAIMAMIVTWIRFGKPDVTLSFNGALAGLVGITAGCASVSAPGAVIIGLGAGLLVVLSVEFIDKVLKIDDPVGAISVHATCGAYGTLMVGLLALDGGLFYGGGGSLLLTQIIGVVSIFVWVMVTSIILFSLIKATFGLRVAPGEEDLGLDIVEHGGGVYNH